MSPTINLDTARPSGVDAGHAPERVVVDPRILVVDANIRRDAELDAEFIASIKEHGVLTAITARRDPLGQLLVVDGQRRTLAAIEAGRDEVTVDVVDGIGDDESRITTQYVVNEHRRGLSAADKVESVRQLSLFGRSATSITKRLRIPRAEVDAALAVAESKATATVLAEHPTVDLLAAATIAEFDDDPEVVAELVEVAETEPSQLEHAASRVRSAREQAAVVAAARDELEAAGVTVLDKQPTYDDKASETISSLTDKPGAKGYPPAIEADAHLECPGHAVYLHANRGWIDGKVMGWRAVRVEYCMDWRGNGHHKRSASNTAGATSGPQSEEQKAERRALVANNKASDAALPVRRAWISELVRRDKLPADASPYVARVLTNGTYWYPDGDVHRLARELMWPTKHDGMGGPEVAAAVARPANADAYLLALAAALVENAMPRDYHRGGVYGEALFALHLRQLEAWGYPLADIEQAFLDARGKKAS
ncbi:ParB/RepB/Spo0J family partition protein [Cellulosimicrobium sp. SL-1]|uniref:ParB/RepB/Spo0J family partition protein n=1 Tax=Cellulosimicrobium sp. SL-1 TaxID=2699423 RepID=UPI0013D74927|nr:ParB/RepB/Spo0J family partition protein [Cellulosimicrobium sp. SL-1]